MARRKKPENENDQQTLVRRTIETISDNATRSEKVSWDRKMDNMVSLLAKLRPIEEQILDLEASKLPILDDIASLRNVMVRECVHPYQFLTYKDGIVHCKFCNKVFKVNQ